MRKATWVVATLAMFSCAQGGTAGDPAPESQASGAPAAPAAPAADRGPCDKSIDGTVTLTDTGACPGVMPAPSRCAAEIVICNGTSPGANGVYGSFAAAATSDGRGSLVLSCQRADSGPPVNNFLFVRTSSGFVSKAPLGPDARPLRDGFVASEGTRLPPAAWDFLAHDGYLNATQSGGALYAHPDGALIVRAENGQLVAHAFAADGTAKGTVAIASLTGSSEALMLGGAATADGTTLVIWQMYGESKASARWIAADGSLASDAFQIAGWTDTAPQSATLAGGAVAIAAQPQSGSTARRWRGVIAAGETVERAAPAWLADRGDFFLLPAGKAMAFGSEIVDGRGSVCGTVEVGAPLVGIGVDGTAFSARNERTFRIHPQLFR